MVRRLPTVICPGCKTPMLPSEPKPLLFTEGLQEVAYTCPSCGTTTVRTMKPDEE